MKRAPPLRTILLISVLSSAVLSSSVAHAKDTGGAAPLAGGLSSDRPLRAEVPDGQRHWKVPVLHTVGILVGMRASLSALWPEHFDPLRFRQMGEQFRTSWTTPPDFRSDRSLFESDGDPWVLNVVGHGLFGSEVYLRFRRCGHRPVTAAASAAIASIAWEYGIESFHKRPSGIDLVWTPLVGSLLGEGRYQLHRLLRAEDEEPTGLARGTLLLFIDPFGEAERALGTGC